MTKQEVVKAQFISPTFPRFRILQLTVKSGVLTRSDLTTYASQTYHESATNLSLFVHFEGRRRRYSRLQKDQAFYFIIVLIGSTEISNVAARF